MSQGRASVVPFADDTGAHAERAQHVAAAAAGRGSRDVSREARNRGVGSGMHYEAQ